MNKDIRDTHDALLDIIGFMSRPEPDVALMSEMSMPLERAHALSHDVKDKLMARFPQIKDAIIHIEPPPRQ